MEEIFEKLEWLDSDEVAIQHEISKTNFFDSDENFNADTDISELGYMQDFSICEEEKNFAPVYLYKGDIEILDITSGKRKYFTDVDKNFICANGEKSLHFVNKKKNFVCIPQNKGVTLSTLNFDEKVYVFESKDYKGNEWVEETLSEFYANPEKYENDIERTHISFEKWVCIGAVYGKLQRLWLSCQKDMNKMPDWVYISFSEIFHIMFPEYNLKKSDMNKIAVNRWKKQFEEVFQYLNTHGMCYRKKENSIFHRYSNVCWDKLLENDVIYEKNRKGEYVPSGIKVKVRGNKLWEFTVSESIMRAVQIHSYDLDLKHLFKKCGFNHGMQKIFIIWQILYKNYWVKNRYWKNYDLLSVDTKEMKFAFSGKNVFRHTTISNTMIDNILQSYCKKNGKRPIHISHLERVNVSKWKWTLVNKIKENSVIGKDESGNYHNIEVMRNEVTLANERLKAINETNAKHRVILDGVRIDTKMSAIFRSIVKGDKWDVLDDKYGRNYTFNNGFQKIKGKDRLRMTIDGKEVNEIDYSGLHLQMLYAIENAKYDKSDMYDLGDWYSKYGLDDKKQRLAVKKMILIMINAPNRSKAWFAFKKEWNELNNTSGYHRIEWMDDLISTIQIKHSKIAKYFCSNKGVELQFIDGKLMREVCYHFARKNVCALPIHDSLVIQDKYKDEAIKVMQDKYSMFFGNRICPIKVKK